jgi:hypothetical protein
MTARRIAAICLLVLCAGCAGQPHYIDFDGGMAAYKSQTASLEIGALLFEQLADPSTHKFTVDQNDPMVVFPDDGKSYVKAFTLPVTTADYHLVIRSYTLVHGFTGTGLYYPLVTFLDADKKPISTTSAADLKLQWGGVGSDEPDEPARVKIDIAITPQSQARYLVIHTEQKWVETGFKEPLDHPPPPAWAFAMVGVVALTMNSVSFPSSPIGPLEISLQDKPS